MPPITRRGMLMGLAAGAAVVAGCGGRAPTATPPIPAGPPADLPLPVLLARNASKEFRAVADALIAAMREARIPGAALGILAGARE